MRARYNTQNIYIEYLVINLMRYLNNNEIMNMNKTNDNVLPLKMMPVQQNKIV